LGAGAARVVFFIAAVGKIAHPTKTDAASNARVVGKIAHPTKTNVASNAPRCYKKRCGIL
jgi:hypothetical protein